MIDLVCFIYSVGLSVESVLLIKHIYIYIYTLFIYIYVNIYICRLNLCYRTRTVFFMSTSISHHISTGCPNSSEHRCLSHSQCQLLLLIGKQTRRIENYFRFDVISVMYITFDVTYYWLPKGDRDLGPLVMMLRYARLGLLYYGVIIFPFSIFYEWCLSHMILNSLHSAY